MAHEVQIEELIAAYLAADLSPEERNAVERRIAEDPTLKSQIVQLRGLLTVLNQGQRQVTPAMVAELKERIALFLSQQSENIPISQLLAAGAVNDLDENERRSVEKFLKENPSAQKELNSLKALSTFLDKGRAPVSAQATSKLAQRLSAKIPSAALAPVLPKATETVSMKLQNQPSTGTSTVRIYIAKENPWRSRAAAVAAAIVLAIGSFLVVQSLKSGPIAVDEGQSGPGRDLPQIVPEDRDQAPQDQQITPEQPDNQNGERPEIDPKILVPSKIIRPPSGPEIKTPEHNVPAVPTPMPNGTRPTLPTLPSDSDIVLPNAPTQHTPSDFEKLKGPQPENPSDNQNTPKITDQQIVKPPVSPDGSGIVPDQQPQNMPQSPDAPKQASNKPVPVPDKLVAANVVGGNVQATTPDNVQVSVAIKQQLPSGSTITTDKSRVAFLLPGGGGLQVHQSSSMTVKLSDLDTTVELASGEFHYTAPPGGSLTVNARSIVVSKANGSALVSLKDGILTTNVLANNDRTSPVVVAHAGSSKKPTTVKAGHKAVTNLTDDNTVADATADPTNVAQDISETPDTMATTSTPNQPTPPPTGNKKKDKTKKKPAGN